MAPSPRVSPGLSARGGPGSRQSPVLRGGSRAASVPLSSTSSTPAPAARASPGLPPENLERLLDRRLQSVSTFVSSTSRMEQDSEAGYAKSLPGAEWSEEMPSVILFPSNKPSSRADAVILDQWVTNTLTRYAEKMASTNAEEAPDLPKVVDELVPILSIGLHEVVRQVTHHCLERGVVLEKIWRTYVELFERALAETRALLRYHKARTLRVDEGLKRTRGELEEVQQRHPEQIEKLSKTLAAKFAQRQEELEDQLRQLRNENAVLKQHLQEHSSSVTAWFPLFDGYKNSNYRETLQSTGPGLPSTTTPEARIAADFKRILQTLPAEGRRRVGFFVSSLLGLRGSQLVENPETVDGLMERKDHNAWKIDLLNTRLKELKGEHRVSTFSAGSATGEQPGSAQGSQRSGSDAGSRRQSSFSNTSAGGGDRSRVGSRVD